MAYVEHRTLTAGQVTTIDLPDARAVEVVNVNGAAAVYFTLDGTAPGVEQAGSHVLPAAIGGVLRGVSYGDGATTVKLIAAAAVKVAVTTDVML